MSDEKDRSGRAPGDRDPTAGRDPDPDVIERYGRKGGSARRPVEGKGGGFWRRMVDRVATPSAPRPRDPGGRRSAVELILPNGKRVLVVVRSPQGLIESGVLELEVEPAPVNNPRILAALEEVSHGLDPADGASADDENLPEVSPLEVAIERAVPAARRPSAEASPLPPVREPAPLHPEMPLPPPAAPRRATPVPPPPAVQEAPTPARGIRPPVPAPLPAPGASDADLSYLDELTPHRTPFGGALPKVETSEMQLPAPGPSRTEGSWPEASRAPAAPEPEAASSRRGPSRGGAAQALFTPPGPPALDAEDNRAPLNLPPEPDELPSRQAGTIPDQGRRTEAPRRDSARSPAAPQDPPSAAKSQREPSVVVLQDLPPEDMAVPPPRPDPRRRYLPVVGIDFGTTYSSIAVMRAGIEVIPDEQGELQMPSAVSFPEPGVVLVGNEARSRMAGAAQWTISSPKRLLGRLHRDPQVGQLIGGLAFRTFAGSDKFIRFEAHGNLYSVNDICAMILGKLRERACRFLNAEVSKAVFTVPVGFGTLQRSALELAARQAGLEVVGMITEPSAAVLSHGFRGRRGLVGVYDFGGGTFDFCLIEVTDTAFKVLCAGGDTWLGGDDFDTAMASYMADLFWNDTGVDLRTRAVEWQALLFACERAKRELTSRKEAEVRADDLLFTAQGKRGLRYKITRKKFVELSRELVEKSIMTASRVMTQAGIKPKKIDSVVLTGGTSLMPMVRDAVSGLFGKQPVLGDAHLAVAKGAALRGAELSGEAVAESSLGGRTLREVSGRTIGASVQGGPVEVLFERDAQLPAEVRRSFYTSVDGQTDMVIALYEEAKSRIDESRTIGHLRYKGLRPAPAGEGRVDFAFTLDEDGILHVSANVEGKQYDKSIKLQ